MIWIERKIVWSITKWLLLAIIIWYLYQVGFFLFLFVWLPWLITYVYGLVVEYGAMRVLSYYKLMWTIIAIMLLILAILVFEIIYRAKRKDFRIGGEFEGRVIWVRGIRQGFIYAVWDLINYINWKRGKKKDADFGTHNFPPDTVIWNGTGQPKWPNAMAIPLGPRIKKQYIFYVKRRPFPFQIVPEKWYVPIDAKVGILYNAYTLANSNFVARPDGRVPGRFTYHVMGVMPVNVVISPAERTSANRALLGRAGKLVDRAILVDAETKKRDFTQGSFSIPQLQEDETVYDK